MRNYQLKKNKKKNILQAKPRVCYLKQNLQWIKKKTKKKKHR